jgi:hypothetical protein
MWHACLAAWKPEQEAFSLTLPLQAMHAEAWEVAEVLGHVCDATTASIHLNLQQVCLWKALRLASDPQIEMVARAPGDSSSNLSPVSDPE